MHDGIQKYGVVSAAKSGYDAKYGYVYAYEVDGLGNVNLEDDANIPSLLSAPYLGYLKADDVVYQNTRQLILSPDNPNFAVGKVASGVGSEHTAKGLGLAISLDHARDDGSTDLERKAVLKELLDSDPGDHLLHESFNPDDPKIYTRKRFGLPNALFSEFILVYFENRTPLPAPDVDDLTYRFSRHKNNK